MKQMFKKHKLLILSIGLFTIFGIIGLGLFCYNLINLSTIPNIKSAASQILPSPENTTYAKVEKYRVPILMYHYIRIAPQTDKLGTKLSVTPSDFDTQLKYFKDQNYTTIHMADLADPNKKEISKAYGEGKKPLVITFDDGYQDAYDNALPILSKYQFNATFYVIQDKIGQPNYLTQDEIDKLKKAGMEIGSHGLEHLDLTKMNPLEARRQIFNSKRNTQVFCYPSGKYNVMIAGLVQQAGYLNAVTTNDGLASQNSNLFEMPRIRMSNTPFDKLKEKIDDTKTI